MRALLFLLFTGKPYPSPPKQNANQNQETPEGWPRQPVFNPPGNVPGPPIQFGDPIKPADVTAGDGFVGNGLFEKDIFYYHNDHLGSTSYISTMNGQLSQHVEYIPFGEVLFEEHSSSISMPYLFNGKELDRETNLTYYGARYLDMKTSLWLNIDPLADYNPIMNDEHYIDGEHNGGVYNPGNNNPYIYCYQNPVKYIDPNGKQNIAGALIGAAVGGGIELGAQLLSGKSLDEVDFADVGIETLKGGLIGSGAGVMLLPYLDATASTAKAAIDLSKKDGLETVGNEKSLGEFAYDAGSDFIGGKIGDLGMKKVGQMAEGSVKKMIKAETKAVKEVVQAENKFIKATKGGTKWTSDAAKRATNRLNAANSSATLARKNTVRAQMVKGVINSPLGDAAKGASQSTITDNIKDFFGIGN
ncbi:RHS repeat domain-containing protein [Flavobacterium columnare]|uniref:RHS repeat domain-containing protein n=1 Tax=Flavobacterium columnare TaxID=996 RepID=UPI000D1A749C|nr:RHS repeat-associated core domain-containing protein [Flavobacterium columnare]PTD16582.1 hypothetical protein C6N29_02955 [Flavobacterium columnare]